MNAFLKELQSRGLVSQITNEQSIINQLDSGATLYCGFDPTADSLHVGSLLPLITLLRFKKAGHTVLPLIGGATGMIGDPSFKAAERTLNDERTVVSFKNAIVEQIKSIVGQDVKVVDNHDWTANMSVLEFLRDIGKHFSVNAMIAKDSVKSRIERPEQGISFTEFSYQLLQGMDFWKLSQLHNCTMQLGGSDQWGNIIAGIDLIHKKEGNDFVATGITMPLVTKSDGTKFGKTESGAVWLSSEKTSPFKFFQFWLGLSDVDTKKLFKLFSFKSVDEIDAIFKEDESRDKPLAQQILAEEMTMIVHGEAALQSVLIMNKALFGGDFDSLSEDDFINLEKEGVPVFTSSEKNIVELLVMTKLTESKRLARDLIKSGGISVNGVKTNAKTFEDIQALSYSKTDLKHNKFLVLKRGRNKFIIIKKI